MPHRIWITLCIVGILLFYLLAPIGGESRVVVYTALDNVYSRQILDLFEERTGIKVLAVYDTEATKSTGLAQRLLREKANPQCDVFWNNEILRSIRLAKQGVLTSYDSPSAEGLPSWAIAKDKSWYGFAARLRVLAYDPAKLKASDLPKSYEELLSGKYSQKFSIANPRFGTTGSHLAILLESRGESWYRDFCKALSKQAIQLASNGATRDKVLSGEYALGWTDTDDVEISKRQGKSIALTTLESEKAILIPNTLSIVKNSPNPENARILLDFLLSPEVEDLLAKSPSGQIPLRKSVEPPVGGIRLAEIDLLMIDYEKASEQLSAALNLYDEISNQ